MPTCLIFGVNGCVGGATLSKIQYLYTSTESFTGTVLVALHKHFPSFTFKAIVRSDSAVDALKSSGLPIEPIKGSHTDAELGDKARQRGRRRCDVRGFRQRRLRACVVEGTEGAL